jgi:hypothetical protein
MAIPPAWLSSRLARFRWLASPDTRQPVMLSTKSCGRRGNEVVALNGAGVEGACRYPDLGRCGSIDGLVVASPLGTAIDLVRSDRGVSCIWFIVAGEERGSGCRARVRGPGPGIVGGQPVYCSRWICSTAACDGCCEGQARPRQLGQPAHLTSAGARPVEFDSTCATGERRD